MSLSNDLNFAPMRFVLPVEPSPFVWSGPLRDTNIGSPKRASKRVELGEGGAEPMRWLRATADAREALEQAALAAAEAAERAMTVAAVLDEALANLALAARNGPQPRGGDAPRAEDVLSPREREVLSLVAEGHSNKAIAATLFVSPNTVKTHVASILHKMRADSRVQLVAMAVRHEASGSLAMTAGRDGNDALVTS
jgi:DNA-binding CsgD family transcriptional regulator